MFTSIFLAILLFIIWIIPSGEECPTCKTHLTECLYGKVLRDGVHVDIIFKYCYKCRESWVHKEDGKDV